jgi:hypothetical protein
MAGRRVSAILASIRLTVPAYASLLTVPRPTCDTDRTTSADGVKVVRALERFSVFLF